MNVSIRDKKILLMFLGILLLVLSYFFVYKGQMEEASVIENENVTLQTRLSELLEMAKNKEFYIEETEAMHAKIQEYCSVFPKDIRPEDGIVLSQNMEKSLDMQISSVGLGEKEFISSLDGKTEEERGEEFEETLMEQGAAATEEQIAEIEETEGISREDAELKAAQQAEMNAAVDAAVDFISSSFSPVLYRTQDTLQFVSTYESLKNAVKYLGQQSGRMTLNNVNASFDSATGNLTGSMTVNLYSMTGTPNIYSEPDAGKVAYGTDNIFGTIEAPVKNKKTKKKKQKNDNVQQSQEAAEGESSQAQDGAQEQ